MFSQCLFFIIFIVQNSSQYFNFMNENEQIVVETIDLKNDQFKWENQCVQLGLWSRYNPLGSIAQVGQIGLFDSKCFNLHNVLEQQTKKSNFLYYDCLDNNSKTVKKIVQFVDDNLNQHDFIIEIDPFQYENTWYYLGVTAWTVKQVFQLILMKNADVLLIKNIVMTYPYFDLNLLFTFGGGLTLTQSSRIKTWNEQLVFSYFPGKMLYYPTGYGRGIFTEENTPIGTPSIISDPQCYCNSSLQLQINDETLKFNELQQSSTLIPYCEKFNLALWVKAIEIHQNDSEFEYKFIKISTDSEDNRLTNDNLSPFQLVYKFVEKKQYIQILTYSFTFPSINIDFSQNPFLIIKELELPKSITIWHYVSVNYRENQLILDLTFYEEKETFKLNYNIVVKHFQQHKLKVQFGNLFGITKSFLNMRIFNVILIPCSLEIDNQACNQTCDICNGPTYTDCLGCKIESLRLYIQEQKRCVCPENTLDQDGQCLTLDDLQITLVLNEEFQKSSLLCEFGSFQYDEKNCFKCPSNVNSNSINCLDCLKNPYTWKTKSICSSQLVFSKSNTIIYNIQISYDYEQYDYYSPYQFDSETIQYCRNCTKATILDENQTYWDYQDKFYPLNNYCHLTQDKNRQCDTCNIMGCEKCKVSLEKLLCEKCQNQQILQNGQCEFTSQNLMFYCTPPEYINSQKICSLCQIENCKFCFQYQRDDIYMNTLYQQFNEFGIDSQVQVGCSLCEDGYQFNFQVGLCEFRKPTLKNCLRSFINLEGNEICTLSNLQTFDISPEITNCQQRILNCEQCIKTLYNVLKCILCIDGYMSTTAGQCIVCTIKFSKKCIQGSRFQLDYWVQLIQSFIIQFLNNTYQYPPCTPFSGYGFIISCQDGYKPQSFDTCALYCSSDCLQCEQYYSGFRCIKCPLNYYNQPTRLANRQCLQCPRLCNICDIRTDEEIKALNPYFIVTQENQQYTYKCYQKIQSDDIYIDPEFLVATLIFANKSNTLNYNFDLIQYGKISLGNDCFPSFVDCINILYCNQIGVQSLQITFNFVSQVFPIWEDDASEDHAFEDYKVDCDYYISSKQDIFTLKQIIFNLVGIDQQEKILCKKISTINFDIIKITNMEIFLMNKTKVIFENDQPVILILKNNSFFGDKIPTVFDITGIYKQIIINNITFANLNLTNSTIFNVPGQYLEQRIEIFNVQIINCQFKNSSLFQIFSNSKDIVVENITITDSIFIDSSIFEIILENLNQQFGRFSNLQFENIHFQNSISLKSINYKNIVIDKISVMKCNFNASNFSSITNNLIIQNLVIDQTYFLNSYFFISITELKGNQIKYLFNDLSIQSNEFQDSQILNIYPVYYNLNFQLIKLTIQNNKLNQFKINQKFLFNIHCTQLEMHQIKIKDLSAQSFFFIYNTDTILIKNFYFTNEVERFHIPLRRDCPSQFEELQILKVFGFENITLENFNIQNFYTKDVAAIELTSYVFFNQKSNEGVHVKNFTFSENILLKQNLGKSLSLMQISSEKTQNIILVDIKFIYNLLHQIIDDPNNLIAGLLYINSLLSNVTIPNILSKYNWITNSSCSFLQIISNNLTIQNYELKGGNYFNQYFFQRYISNLDQLYLRNQEEIQIFAQNFLSIQTKGISCIATVSRFQISKGKFSQIYSKTNSLFEINTQGEGLILLENILVQDVFVENNQISDVQGSIKIYSQNSLLNLIMMDISFTNVNNKFSTSILSITPSQTKNNINLKNIIFINCLSFQSSIIKVQFSELEKQQNVVQMQNISIKQTEEAWQLFFQKNGQLSNSDIQKILNDNALINFVSCSLLVDNLYVSGILISPIIQVIDPFKFQMINCQFISIKAMYSFSLIYIGQNKYNAMKIILSNNEFRNISLYQSKTGYLIEQLFLKNYFIQSQCLIGKNTFQFYKLSFFFNEVIHQLQSTKVLFGQFIQISSLSNKTIVQVSSLKIINNDCNFCDMGLITLEIIDIKKLQIYELICVENKILNNGCLNIQKNNKYQNKLTIKYSVIALNQGQSKTGLNLSNMKAYIFLTFVFNNTAGEISSGINANLKQNNFQFNRTQIFQNSAEQCGGILLNGSANIDDKNFYQSIVVFNKANKLAQNLVETPSQLSLSINDKKMKSNIEKFDNLIENFLVLQTYKTLQQETFFYTNYLMLPSDQKVVDFRIFNLKTQKYYKYITEFSVYFENSLREQLGNLEQNCTVFQYIQYENGSFIEKNEVSQVQFDSKFNKIDLGNLQFTFDPYLSQNKIQQIEILCKINENRTLSYKINTKSFYCQLGEFYTLNGCQKCNSTYGFYSVSYNATKCSVFDKTKFQNITSNEISLLFGFWRPDFLSDSPELCIKDTTKCLGGWNCGDQSCLTGHVGGLCEECDVYNTRGQGYYFKNPENSQCLLCNQNNSYLIIFVIISCISIISIFLTLKSIGNTNQLFANTKLKAQFFQILFKLNQDHESFLIKMFLNYLWMFSIIFTYDINFSFNLKIIDQTSNPSYFMANNLDCYLSENSGINLIYLRVFATIFLIVCQLLFVYFILYMISKFMKKKFDFSNISNTTLYLYLSNQAALTKQFCSLIAKRLISNIDFVQGNVALKYYSQNHINWIYAFILPGLSINVCLIPILLITILFIKRHQLDKIKVRKHICYLFNEYNDKNYYWEQIKIWQKTFLIVIMIYFEDQIFQKTILIGLALILYQYLTILRKPYILSSLNTLDFQTGQICSIAIFIAASKSELNQQSQADVSNILQILIAILCIVLIYQYVFIILRVYVKKYKLLAFQYLLSFIRLISSKSLLSAKIETIYKQEQSKRDKLISNYDILRKHLVRLTNTNNSQRHKTRYYHIEQSPGKIKIFTESNIHAQQISAKLI